jgi:hypothetical protein
MESNTSKNPQWIRLPDEKPKFCKFCRQPVYWKKSDRHVDQHGNVIYAPPREARILEDGTVEYREVPHKCRRSPAEK